VKNLLVRAGTPAGDILKAASLQPEDGDSVVIGGPMRGTAVESVDFPVAADTQAVYVGNVNDIITCTGHRCVNCGKCNEICPEKLPVGLMARYAEFSLFDLARGLDVDWCIECGLCSYICPVRRPLVQFIRLAKSELAKSDQDKKE
jgi:electron transport complex protein RnfC